NGNVVSDVAYDVLKIAMIDRYSGSAPAIGFIKNFGLKRGAIASSVSHDSHNLLAVGVDDESLARAMNLLIECQGGISVVGTVNGEKIEAVLPLPIAGLMSGEDGRHVAKEYSRIDALAKELGSKLGAPYMTLSFMALLVIPSLKLGPQGLFDVNQFKPVSMWE
ncbi:MAG TPA: adenine deaminase C-terminal domain-containing protein, partial [Pirellulales bacterium]